jgi:hypothetical protein
MSAPSPQYFDLLEKLNKGYWCGAKVSYAEAKTSGVANKVMMVHERRTRVVATMIIFLLEVHHCHVVQGK